MFIQNLRARLGARLSGDSEAGFTLIELLVVMLILGILAAIALPAFFNQRDKAGDSKAKENAHSAQVAVETYATENSGSYGGVTLAKLQAIEPTIKKGEPATTGTGAHGVVEGIAVAEVESGKGYLITSYSSTGNEFKIENKEGTMKYTCKAPGSGGCPAVENVATEPEADWSK